MLKTKKAALGYLAILAINCAGLCTPLTANAEGEKKIGGYTFDCDMSLEEELFKEGKHKFKKNYFCSPEFTNIVLTEAKKLKSPNFAGVYKAITFTPKGADNNIVYAVVVDDAAKQVHRLLFTNSRAKDGFGQGNGALDKIYVRKDSALLCVNKEATIPVFSYDFTYVDDRWSGDSKSTCVVYTEKDGYPTFEPTPYHDLWSKGLIERDKLALKEYGLTHKGVKITQK